jgi:hypothetical protein
MFIAMQQLPAAQDPHIVLACLRACVWARIEGWPFCLLK